MISVKQPLPGILHLEFDSCIEAGAHLCRYQEFYECSEFKGKPFQLLDYIKYYASKHDGNFMYFSKVYGYNIPADEVIRCYEMITDRNDHDHLIYIFAKRAQASSATGKGYLIATSLDKPGAIDHELAPYSTLILSTGNGVGISWIRLVPSITAI